MSIDATGDLFVQGYVTNLDVPAGEAVVRLPAEFILRAAETLRAEGVG